MTFLVPVDSCKLTMHTLKALRPVARDSTAETFLAQLARNCHARGWAFGTSCNFSAVVSREPLVLTITATGLDKSSLSPEQFVRVDASGTVIEGSGGPSAETGFASTSC